MNLELKKLEKDVKKYKVSNNCEKREILSLGISNFYKTVPQLKNMIEQIEKNIPLDETEESFINPDDPKWNKTKSLKKISGGKIDTIIIKKSYKMYKGFNGFITPDMENKYYDIMIKPNVLWYTIKPIYAFVYTEELNGGLNVYKLNKDINLAVWNTNLVEIFYNALLEIYKNNPDNVIYKDMITYYKISLGWDISNKERLAVFAHYKPYGKYNEEWDTVCFGSTKNDPWDVKDFYYKDIGSYQRMRGTRTVIYRYLILPILMQMGIDGIIIPQHKNPYIIDGGVFSQEIILHSPNEIITRDITDPLDWMNWKELNKEIPNIFNDGFNINVSCVSKNRDFRMIKWFYKQRELEQKLLQSDKSSYTKNDKDLSVCTLNVFGFNSIDGSQTNDDCISHLIKFVETINCDIICLQEVYRKLTVDLIPKMKEVGFIYHTDIVSDKFGNITFSKLSVQNSSENIIRDIDDKNNAAKHNRTSVNITLFMELLKISNTHLSIGKRYHNKSITKKEENNILTFNDKIRLEEVKKILNFNSNNSSKAADIILGDFNAVSGSLPIKYLINNGYTTNYTNYSESNPFGTIVDHIFLSKEFIKKYKSYKIISYPYNWSDHNAIILIINNFF